MSEDYHKQRSDSLDGNRDSKPNKRSHGLHTERTPLLSTAKTPKSPSSSKRRDLAVYAVQPARDSDNGAVCLADGEGNSDPILIRELPRPAEVVRDLAENGTELAIQEGPNGGIRRKWLEISDRQQDQTNPAENGVMQAASSSKRSDSLVSRSQDTLKRMIGKSDSKSSRSGRSFYASKVS